MKKQDLMNQINEMTKDIPIPDSISPENMKKMLEQQSDMQNTFDDATSHSTPSPNSTSTIRNRKMRQLAVAACVVLCLAGGITTIQSNKKSLSETASDTAYYDSAESMEMDMEESVAEEMYEDVDNSECKVSEEELTSQTNLESPSSYDEYYETLTDAYREYYDLIASVTYNSTTTSGESKSAASKQEAEDFAISESVTDAIATGGATSDNLSANTKQRDFSSTNTQEETVDEGDIIKTDGTYIYKVISDFNEKTRTYDCRLTITETDNGNMRSLATIDLNPAEEHTVREFHEFYLYRNHLIVLYTQSSVDTAEASTKTNIVIYDINDKENPKELKSLTQSGHYESSRISDGFLYIISNFNETNLETSTPYTNYIPTINGVTIDCADIYYSGHILMNTTYLITSVDLNDLTDYFDTAAIPTNGGQLYVSDSAIYIYSTSYRKTTNTEITKIFYKKGTLSPGKSATITGYLYNSFALSEYKEHLRIVANIPANTFSVLRTTDDVEVDTSLQNQIPKNDIPLPEDINVIYVFDKDMQLTGKLSRIAPGEKIYSARFMGDIGYFVTFKNMDPLFSVDLSDPTNPTIIGQLKIPGFSNYLHLYNDNLLFGLGEEINANTGEFLGLKLSMFDISDPSNVTEQDKFIIDNSNYSNAQYNHKAIMINPQKNIIGFVYEGTSPSTYNYQTYYVTYTYKKGEGFIETARYPLTDSYDFATESVRGVYIGDILYIATNTSITSYPIGSTDPLAQLYFQ